MQFEQILVVEYQVFFTKRNLIAINTFRKCFLIPFGITASTVDAELFLGEPERLPQ
jgi:hypothetical protein